MVDFRGFFISLPYIDNQAENQLSKDAETEGQPLMNVDSMFLDKKATKPRLLMFDTTDKADRFYFGKSGIADTRNVGVW